MSRKLQSAIVMLAVCGAAVPVGIVIAQNAGTTPAPAQPNPDTAQPEATKPGEKPNTQPIAQEKHVIRFDGGVEVFIEGNERVEVAAKVLGGQLRPLEYLVVTQAGASHEALFRVDCDGYDLHQGLELIGLPAGKKKLAFRGDPTLPDGAPVDVTVEWGEGKDKKTHPVEDWIFNIRTNKVLERGPWTFTGSVSEFREDVGREIYLADQLGNIMAVWRDPSCVVNNPRASATDDKAFAPTQTEGLIPPPGTEVKLVFRRWKDEDKAGNNTGGKPPEKAALDEEKSTENQPSGNKGGAEPTGK